MRLYRAIVIIPLQMRFDYLLHVDTSLTRGSYTDMVVNDGSNGTLSLSLNDFEEDIKKVYFLLIIFHSLPIGHI